MEEEKKIKRNHGGWVAGIAAAALIGAALGMLYAPRSGKETRAMLKDRVNNIRDKMSKK